MFQHQLKENIIDQMDFNLPPKIFEDFTKTLAVKYFQYLKKNWNMEGYVDEKGEFTKWDTLNPNYEKWKESKVGKQKILIFNGEMLNSFQYKVDGEQFTIWTDVEYAKYHQEGTDKITRRPILFIDNNFILKQFIKYIQDGSSDFTTWIKKSILDEYAK
jgi:phage gpG-like protein